MKISQNGIDVIKEFEGCRLQPYLCPAGVLTIGYGSTGTHVKAGMRITQTQAEELLRKDVERFEKGVEELVTVPITQSQFDALVSFSFNVGLNALKNSTLLRLINQRKHAVAGGEFSKWVYGGSEKLPGLIARRDKEMRLFFRERFLP